MHLATRPLNGLEARAGLEAFAVEAFKALAKNDLHQIVWHAGGAQIDLPRRTVYLPALDPRAVVSAAALRKTAGYIVHELLHARWSQPVTATPYLHRLYNGLEDARIERKAIREALTGNVSGLLRSLLADHLPPGIDWQTPGNFPFSLAVSCRDYPGLTCPPPAGLEAVWAHARSRIDSLRDSDATLALAEWVLEQIQQQQEQQQQQQQQEQDGEQDDEQQQPGEQGQPDQQDDQQDQQDDQQDQQDGQQQGQQQDQQDGPDLDSLDGIDPEPHSEQEDMPTLTEGHLRTEPGDQAILNRQISDRDPRSIQGHASPALRYAMRRLLDNSATDDMDQGRKTGAVNPRALHRAGFDPAIFARRREEAGIESAIYIMLDASGSMTAAMSSALNACGAIYRAAQAAGAACAIGQFGGVVGTVVKWGTPVPKAIDALGRIRAGGGTPDAQAAHHALGHLATRREQRRLLMMITDGDGNGALLSEQLQAAESVGIRTFGLAIGNDASVEAWYPRHGRINKPEDLGPATFKSLMEALR
jgi:Mg-chelatase subunit ChlD